jgi:predicted transcriptional regulator
LPHRRLDELGRRERQIVEAVYRLRRATVTDVLEALPDPPTYSTVRAMLGKLEQKGYLRHEEQGPRYVYLPAVSADRARRTALRDVVDTFFDGSAEEAVLALVRLSEDKPADDVLERLAERARQAEREGR